MEDVRTLRDELLVDQASFFMLTPLPGSRDHRDAGDRGTPMDSDSNNFDSFRAVTAHPLMSAADWTAAYRDAWTSFYSFEDMRQALLRQNPHTYWGLFKCFLWYRAAMIEGSHPMVTGFFRRKDRRSRRPGLPVEGRLPFFRRRCRESAHIVLAYGKLLLEMQELWLATRIRREEYGWVGDLRALRTRATAMLEVKRTWARAHAVVAATLRDWRTSIEGQAAPVSTALRERVEAVGRALGQRADELARQGSLASLRVHGLPSLRPRPGRGRLASRLNLLRIPTLEARQTLTAYWAVTERRLRRWQVWRVNPVAFAWNAARDVRNLAVFVTTLARERY
jgi:hypothetical protein